LLFHIFHQAGVIWCWKLYIYGSFISHDLVAVFASKVHSGEISRLDKYSDSQQGGRGVLESARILYWLVDLPDIVFDPV
jgi:hypothetical protein